MKPLATMAVLAGLLGASPALADTFYVATDGDDGGGDGSAGNPWATIDHALRRGVPAAGGHTVLVRDGTYEGLATLSRGFAAVVEVRAENDYRAILTNANGGAEVLRVFVDGAANLTVSGFIMTNEHPSNEAAWIVAIVLVALVRRPRAPVRL